MVSLHKFGFSVSYFVMCWMFMVSLQILGFSCCGVVRYVFGYFMNFSKF
jgi:hypothetical protein